MANETPSKLSWNRRRQRKADRLVAASPFADGRILAPETIVQALEILIRPGDRVAIEGNNQKQADFLSRALARADAEKIHDLHLLMSSVSRREHLDLFENGIARKIDFAYAGPQSLRMAQLLEGLRVGNVLSVIGRYISPASQ